MGTITLVALACVVVPYFLIGAVVMRYRGASGKDLVPNRDVWTSLFGLIAAGCLFTFGAAKRKVLVARGFEEYEAL